MRRCAELHLEHIATGGDPFELGSSRPLDFGHWAAHKLEQMTDNRLRHGEAVAHRHRARHDVLICRAACREAEWRRIIDAPHGAGLPIWLPRSATSRDSGNDQAACCMDSRSSGSTSGGA